MLTPGRGRDNFSTYLIATGRIKKILWIDRRFKLRSAIFTIQLCIRQQKRGQTEI